MSPLPLPATGKASNADLRLTDPTDVDVYFIGASGVQPRLGRRTGSILGGLQPQPEEIVVVREEEHNVALRTTDEQARLSWQAIQRERGFICSQITRTETQIVHAIRDDSPLRYPDKSSAIGGQLEPGLMLHACAMTEVGRNFLHSRSSQEVAVIHEESGGSSAAVATDANPPSNETEPLGLLEDELNRDQACEFGAKVCQRTATEWAAAQLKDATASSVMTYNMQDPPSCELKEEGSDPRVDIREVKRFVLQGKIMELTNTEKLLVRRPSRAPPDRPGRNPGRHERLLGDEPVRTYVPLLLRPWVMDCAHKEAVHLGEKVTLGLLL